MSIAELKNGKLKDFKDKTKEVKDQNYILKKDDMEEFKVLIECINTLYR
jgi:hypothetical protein